MHQLLIRVRTRSFARSTYTRVVARKEHGTCRETAQIQGDSRLRIHALDVNTHARVETSVMPSNGLAGVYAGPWIRIREGAAAIGTERILDLAPPACSRRCTGSLRARRQVDASVSGERVLLEVRRLTSARPD